MIDVACVKWGTLYGPQYVNRLYEACKRHLHCDFRFHCITDSRRGIAEGVTIHGFPDKRLRKWWGKVYLFSDVLGDVDRCLFFDLDTVICDDLSFLTDYQGDFAALQGFGFPFRLGSGVMSFRPSLFHHIWNEYEKDPVLAQALSGQWGDGQWIQLNVGPFDRLQHLYPGKFRSFKWECNDGVPEGTAIVAFHGEPRPHQVDGPWMAEHWRDAA